MKQKVFKVYIGSGDSGFSTDWFLISADDWPQASRKAVKRSEDYAEHVIVKMEVLGEID